MTPTPMVPGSNQESKKTFAGVAERHGIPEPIVAHALEIGNCGPRSFPQTADSCRFWSV